ncbi:MAG: hypothetical protein IKX36_09185 [Prevotella sp.]|nr:hypothetical protein [Prevotella sp.]
MYEQEILNILTSAGDKGLKVDKIARHVFNNCNSFFETHSLKEIRQCVATFLQNNSRTSDGLVEKIQWGIYKLNKNSAEARQLLMQFADENEEKEKRTRVVEDDKTLSLF